MNKQSIISLNIGSFIGHILLIIAVLGIYVKIPWLYAFSYLLFCAAIPAAILTSGIAIVGYLTNRSQLIQKMKLTNPPLTPVTPAGRWASFILQSLVAAILLSQSWYILATIQVINILLLQYTIDLYNDALFDSKINKKLT